MFFRAHPLLMAAVAIFLASPLVSATEPQRLYERYTTICAEITELQKAPEYESGNYSERRAMERRLIESAYDVPEVQQTFRAVAQADPNRKYDLLQQTIKLQTGRSWSCEALKQVR